jgi:citrate synthase
MPEQNIRSSEKPVELDTSGPEVDVFLEDTKEEAVVNTAPETTEQETVVEEVKTEEEKQEDDSKLEDYSKGVQSRIAKLTRKMREAERKEAAALEYAAAVENKRKQEQDRFNKTNSEYTAKFEENVKTLNLMNIIKKLIRGLELTLATNLVILILSKRTGPFSR